MSNHAKRPPAHEDEATAAPHGEFAAGIEPATKHHKPSSTSDYVSQADVIRMLDEKIKESQQEIEEKSRKPAGN